MLGSTELLFLSLPLLGIAINKILNYKPEPIFNVYQRPNAYYWVKVTFMFVLLYMKQLFSKIRLALKDEKNLLKYHEQLERNQQISSHKQATNGVYFNACNYNGDHLIVAMTKRNNRLVDGYIYLRIDNERIGLLESLKIPDTTLYQNDDSEGFQAEGISIQCVEPMKKWIIKYQGQMKRSKNPSKTVFVDLEMTYTSTLPMINFETDSDPLTTAKCIALERWNKEFFQLLEGHRQTQYEQHGNLEGHAIINGEIFYLDMYSHRNHSFGEQGNWRNVHRYNLHMFFTEDGDRFTVGEYCFPLTLSSFKMGFMYSAEDNRVYPITYNDFQLYQHGESGKPPLDYAFTIEAGGKIYTIKVDVVDSSHFYISKDWESKIIQRFCTFKVNSSKGWGTSECQQRNMSGRNITEEKSLQLEKNSKPDLVCKEKSLSSCDQSKSSLNSSNLLKLNSKDESENQRQKNEKILHLELICEHCAKVCDSRIELWKHLRTHD